MTELRTQCLSQFCMFPNLYRPNVGQRQVKLLRRVYFWKLHSMSGVWQFLYPTTEEWGYWLPVTCNQLLHISTRMRPIAVWQVLWRCIAWKFYLEIPFTNRNLLLTQKYDISPIVRAAQTVVTYSTIFQSISLNKPMISLTTILFLAVVVVAPYGSSGCLTGCCAGDLVTQLQRR